MADFDQVIPAGQSGKITAAVNTKTYTGKLTKSIVVVSNDPENPLTKVYIECSVLGVKLLPSTRMNFATDFGESVTKTVSIATLGEGPLDVDVQSSLPQIQLKLTPLTGNKRPEKADEYYVQYKLAVTLPEDMPEGRFSGTITITTNSKYNPSVRVLIGGVVNPPIIVSPRSIRLVNTDEGDKLSRILTLTKKEGKFKIERFETTPKELKATLIEKKPGQQYEAKLSWDGAIEKKLIYGKIVFYTDDIRKPMLAVPVYITGN